jgi:EAL domain-containing protein (putative c-di-GMP-specific phosphodiesterase class I)
MPSLADSRSAAPTAPPAPPPLRVLVLDDDRTSRTMLGFMLRTCGFAPTLVSTVAQAEAALDGADFDVVVSDINLGGESGLQFLATRREKDAELPFVLVTGSPALETAVSALNLGAFRYLLKPVLPDDLEVAVRRAGMARSFARLQREALAAVRAEDAVRSQGQAQLASAMAGVWMAWQPIVQARGTGLYAYEALLRTDEATLSRPDHFLASAQQFGRMQELGRAVRGAVAAQLAEFPADALAFVNIVPADLNDPELADPGSPLSAHAHRVVLEVTERSQLDAAAGARVRAVRQLGYRLAVDDLGAGYSGLSSIMQLEPDFVKLDRSLVRELHESAARRTIVESLLALSRSMGTIVVAEGVELREEAEVLWALGVPLTQGYYFGRPQRELRWAPPPA